MQFPPRALHTRDSKWQSLLSNSVGDLQLIHTAYYKRIKIVMNLILTLRLKTTFMSEDCTKSKLSCWLKFRSDHIDECKRLSLYGKAACPDMAFNHLICMRLIMCPPCIIALLHITVIFNTVYNSTIYDE